MEHDVIRVTGARENNLQGIDVGIPKRALTVFTGVSGSGKSSLVFNTVAAESQRLINETHPGFVQGFMESLARPDVDSMSGLTAAVVVGQEPLAANPRSTFGTATDITALLRILYARVAEPSAGGPAAYSFNVPSVTAQGAITVDKAGAKKEVTRFSRTGGMCPACEGTGRVSDIDLHAIVDEDATIDEGAIKLPGLKVGSWTWKAYAQSGLYPTDKPIRDFTAEEKQALFYEEDIKVKVNGVNMTYQGLVPRMRGSMLAKDPESLQKHVREFVEKAVQFVPCPECDGTRLARHARESYIAGKSIADLCEMELTDLAAWLDTLDDPRVAPLVESARQAIGNAIDIGLGYLTLARPVATLSGGEAQRTRMVQHLGSALTDVTYVFDEPTAGLHPHDVERLNNLLEVLRDKGNTVLVVEHNPATIAIADHIVEIGPGAGTAGGTVTFAGSYADIQGADTVTGRHLADAVTVNENPRKATGTLAIRGATAHNLKDIDVDIPTGVLTAVTGVAGSGKSSLLMSLPTDLADTGRLLYIGQDSIRGSRRSNPATFTGALDPIRKVFAKENGVKPGLFSPNSDGACPECKGAGVVHIDLGLTAGADVTCAVCEGRRFAEDVLDYRFGGKNIAEVLALPAAEAAEFFRAKEHRVPAAARVCATLTDVGLGYLTLGQPLNTLSGGERQRLKIAVYLSDKKASADTVVLDEPTTGLHLADIEMILGVLDQLVDAGATVIVVEHNLAVIAHADHIIDLGPGAGSAGGRVVVAGTPTDVMSCADSLTGAALRREMRRASGEEGSP